MGFMLPAEPARARSLTGTLPLLYASLTGRQSAGALPLVRTAIVVLVDGLGSANLAAVPGHARFLTATLGKRDVAISSFPTTTAAALTGLLTAQPAGRHGIVGYRVHVPGAAPGTAVNQLTGWSGDHGGELDPATWQRAAPFAQQHDDVPFTVVTKPEYTASGFTRATSDGARIVAAAELRDRFISAVAVAPGEGGLVYVYVPELDQAGHRYGWRSDRWLGVLEIIDDELRRFAGMLPADAGAVVTGDHGMVDVSAEKHVLIETGGLTEGVATIAGEPRMLHLYAHDGAAEAVHDAWSSSEQGRSWVLTRAEAVASGLFGETDPVVSERIGDVLVAARSDIAYYDARDPDEAPRRMIGQHGSLTSAERIVPFARLGAFAAR